MQGSREQPAEQVQSQGGPEASGVEQQEQRAPEAGDTLLARGLINSLPQEAPLEPEGPRGGLVQG